MDSLKALVMMQIKDKLEVKAKNFKSVLFRIVLPIIKFLLLVFVIFALFYVLSSFSIVSREKDIPKEFLVILFSIMFVLSLITATLKMMNSLYFGKDNAFLLCLPVKKSQIFLSKIIVFFIYELIRNISFILPLFIAFGMVNAYPLYYYLWTALATILITIFIVIIGALLSIPAMIISIIFKRRWIIKLLAITALTGIVVYGLIMLISLIPADLNILETWNTTFWKLQDFMKNFYLKAGIISLIVDFVVGTKVVTVKLFSIVTLKAFLIMLAITIVVWIITLLLVKPLFFKMASVPFEYIKNENIKKKENLDLPPFMSFVKKEFLIFSRNSSKIYPLIAIAISLPLAILLLNKIYAAMSVRAVGNFMTISFNIMIILLIALSSNATLATIASEEGASAYLLKINPNSYIKSLFPKLIINIVIMTISIICAVIIFSYFSVLTFWQGVLLFLAIEMFYLTHAFWSADMDIMNPQYSHYATTGTHQNNPNERKSTALAFIMSFIVAFAVFVLLNENMLNYYVVWMKLLIVGIGLLVLRVYLYVTRIKLYYKEK